jgi:release factor glutamine methyltransferase
VYAKNLSNVYVYAADLSSDAVSLANKNIKYHQLEERVRVREGNLLDPFDGDEYYKKIDLLTCNPPYISSAKVEIMHEEISHHEPRMAFDGGPFGIKILHNLIQQAPRYLREGGWLAFEVGLGQGSTIMKRMSKNTSYLSIISVKDENGDIRVVLGQV